MMEEEFEKPNPHGPLLVSIWIGAVVLWAFKGFRGKLNVRPGNKKQSLNIWIGYVVQLFVVAVLVYFAYKK